MRRVPAAAGAAAPGCLTACARPDRQPGDPPGAARGLDSARRAITVGDLVSMHTGLRSTSVEGYGGQLVFVVPSLAPVVVATSDPEPARRDGGHLRALHDVLDPVVVAAGG